MSTVAENPKVCSIVENALLTVARRMPRVEVDRLISLLVQDKLQAFSAGPTSVIVAGIACSERRAHIYAAAGKLQELTAALPKVEQWYSLRGAERMTISGREGWQRVLKPHGYARDGMLLVKGLDCGR